MAQQLLEAVKKGDTVVVKELLRATPGLANSKTNTGESAVMLAMYYGHEEVAQILIAHGAKLDIFEAVAVGNTERARELVRTDPGLINSFSHDGFTPLHLAAFFGNTKAVELLIQAGADLNAISKNKTFAVANTPLDAVIAGSHANSMEIAKLLLEKGADPNARSHGDVAPIHEAVAQSDLEMIRLLLSYGADINARKMDGTTPLAIALDKQNKEIAQFLRQHGAE